MCSLHRLRTALLLGTLVLAALQLRSCRHVRRPSLCAGSAHRGPQQCGRGAVANLLLLHQKGRKQVELLLQAVQRGRHLEVGVELDRGIPFGWRRATCAARQGCSEAGQERPADRVPGGHVPGGVGQLHLQDQVRRWHLLRQGPHRRPGARRIVPVCAAARDGRRAGRLVQVI